MNLFINNMPNKLKYSKRLNLLYSVLFIIIYKQTFCLLFGNVIYSYKQFTTENNKLIFNNHFQSVKICQTN